MATFGCGEGQAFRLGYVAGLVHYLASLYWLLNIPVAFGPIVGWFALAAYLALYSALWVWLCWKMLPQNCSAHERSDAPPPLTSGHPLPSSDEGSGSREGVLSKSQWRITFLGHSSSLIIFRGTWQQRFIWIFLCAALWVALEMTVARLFTGFPWNLLGVSQYQILPLVQIASATGVYGVSFLIVWFSVSLASGVAILFRQPTVRFAWLKEVVIPLLVVIATVVFGLNKIVQSGQPMSELKVTLVQPSIPQTLIWDPKEDTTRFKRLVALSERALADQPDLLIWPEAATPSLFGDREFYPVITNLVRTHRTWLLLGADDAELSARSASQMETNFYNSSFLLNPMGEVVANYRKRQLVIFGEYVPLVRWLPFMKHLTPIGSGFTSGDRAVPFKMTTPRATMAVLICFEDTFPHLARKYVQDDTDFLVNLTNNGWFGDSAAQWQHAATAVFRAVENGVPLVRCTNNGLTCWVDEYGHLRQIFGLESKNVYGEGFMIAKIPLLAPGEKRARTFYNRYGDWFGWGCIGLSVSALALRFRAKKSK
jgi:apolipoprotein N-acyltransferase